jgi:hypothetical protein
MISNNANEYANLSLKEILIEQPIEFYYNKINMFLLNFVVTMNFEVEMDVKAS